jgi:hypothetical protein
LKEQMMIKKNKEANSVILMQRPVKIQDMDQQFFLDFID